MSYVIRMPNAIPFGQCWYADDSDGDHGRTFRVAKAAEFVSLSAANKKLRALRDEYPDVEFVVDPAPVINEV